MKKKVWSLMLAGMMALSLGACGTGKESAEMTEETAVTETPANETVETLKIGMAGVDIKTACIIIAKQLGYYEEAGVNVEFETISNLNDGLVAVTEGKLDVLPFGVIPTATFVSQGSDAVVIGGTIAEGSEAITTPENADNYKTAEDFRGKKIACFRMETGHMVMKNYLREAGLEIGKDVEFVYLDSSASEVEAVQKGEADLAFVNSGYGYVAQQSGMAVAFQVGKFVEGFPCCRQTTSKETLETKRDALVKFEEANLRAYAMYLNDHDASIQALADYSGQESTYVQAVMYGIEGEYDNAMIVSLDPSKKKVTEFYEIMKANGDIEADTEYTMEDHIDTSIFEDALQAMINQGDTDGIYSKLMEEFKANN